MKKFLGIIFTIAFLVMPFMWTSGHCATYYVDKTTGDDGDTGLTEALAWETIAKVNSVSFAAGDFVLFKRGEIWRENLIVPTSGSSGNVIKFGAYGTGDDPIISGANIIGAGANDWTQVGASNIYTATRGAGTPRSGWEDAAALTLAVEEDTWVCIEGASKCYGGNFSTEPTVILFEDDGTPTIGDGPKATMGDLVNEYDYHWSGTAVYIYAGGEHPDDDYALVTDMTQGSWQIGTFPNVYVWSTDDADPDDHVIELCQRTDSITINDKDYITIDGIHCDKPCAWGAAYGGIYVYDSDEVIIQNCTATNGVQSQINVTTGSDNCVVDNCTVSSLAAGREADGITFINTRGISGGKWDDVAGAITNFTVKNCTALNIITGIAFYWVDTGLIENNTAHDINSAGITARWANDVIVQKNHVYDILDTQNSQCINIGGNDADSTYNMTIRWNVVHDNNHIDNDGGGILLDIGCYDSEVYGNLAYNLDGPGINSYRNHDNVFHHNILYNTGNGVNDKLKCCLKAGLSYNINFFNNTCYGSPYGVVLNGNDGIGEPTYNINVKNNIFSETAIYGIKKFEDVTTGIVFDHNCWLSADSQTSMVDWNGTWYDTLADFQTGQSQGANSISADPMFRNAANGDFALKWGSPCINTGDSSIGQDYDDALDPRDTTFPYDTLDQDNYGDWEIGAFVYRRRFHIGKRIKDIFHGMGHGMYLEHPTFVIVQ